MVCLCPARGDEAVLDLVLDGGLSSVPVLDLHSGKWPIKWGSSGQRGRPVMEAKMYYFGDSHT